MVRCVHCVHSKYCKRHSKIRLVHRDSLHPSMWINPHIHTQYRPLDLPWSLCAKSIFQLNNETLNIWSHLLGFIYIGAMQYWCAFCALPKVDAPLADYVVMAGSMTCSQICMALSASYHTFGCQSAERRVRWLKADLFGVSLALLGIYLSGIYTSFYRFPEVQRIYAGCLAVILAISLSIPLFSANEGNSSVKTVSTSTVITTKKRQGGKAILNSMVSRTDTVIVNENTVKADAALVEKHNRRIGLIHLIYISLALFGLYPTWHWMELHGGISSPHVMEWLPTLVILFLLIGLAFFFYATLIPERFFPGKFDVVGCSHQWWHLLILTALIYWHDAGVRLLAHYHTTDTILLNNRNDGGGTNAFNSIPGENITSS